MSTTSSNAALSSPGNAPEVKGPGVGKQVLLFGFCLLLAVLAVFGLGLAILPWALGAGVILVVGLLSARGQQRYMIPAAAAMAGQLTMLLVALIAQPVKGTAAVLATADVLIMVAGLITLLTVRHLLPAILLVAYNLVGLFFTFTHWMASDTSWLQRTFFGGIMLQLLTLSLLTWGLAWYDAFIAAAKRDRAARAAAPAPMPATAPPAPAPAAPASPARADKVVSDQTAEDLRRLAALTAEGVITKDEFEAKKKKILGI